MNISDSDANNLNLVWSSDNDGLLCILILSRSLAIVYVYWLYIIIYYNIITLQQVFDFLKGEMWGCYNIILFITPLLFML